MANPIRIRAVYKVVDGQEIDTDIYLPHQDDTHSLHPVLINIHGGAFMLGSSEMVNPDQISDCLARGWIVVVPNHRLCPGVNVLEGPMQDCRDLLSWIYDGSLQKAIPDTNVDVDCDHVFAFGTSSGGHLALSLGFGVDRPVAGIYDMYGPCNFSHPFWTTPLPYVPHPDSLSKEIIDQVYGEKPVPIRGGVSLEGQRTAPGPPDMSDPRQAFAFSQISGGTVLKAIYPSEEYDQVDPLKNIDGKFPPTYIVHGQDDKMVPIDLSRDLLEELKRKGVKCDMTEIPGEGHTFAARMKAGSRTWELQRLGFDFLESLIER
ncbi:Alpha/Beta hydrolase protein [Diplogelasinospora grovesii]|uniref:Alpha/Beta hydrolase protein n=1 Tax=Diplogelasinospora grovesii TaxID=303347 RepID=A0AAN6NCB7_9PEZI|nr:Alpha/Beta hydrolase protein [Diplogelasinospora grovesii]